MFKIARPSNRWVFRSHNGLLYPKFPLRLLACGLLFISCASVAWLVYPPMDSTAAQFYAFGIFVLLGLVVAAEFVFRSFLARVYWERPWQVLVMHELLIPVGFAFIIFHQLIYGPINFFEPEPREPIWIMAAAKRWAWGYFLALMIFYGLLWLMEQLSTTKGEEPIAVGEEQQAVKEFRMLSQIGSILQTEILRLAWQRGVRSETGWEVAKTYLETPPKEFKKYFYYLGSPAVFPIYPYFTMEEMVLDCNLIIAEDELVLVNTNDEDGSGKAGLLFKNRRETFTIPTFFSDMDEMVAAMAKVLMPDFELRHCRLVSHQRILQSIMCLRPEQWDALTKEYGERKMRKYFTPIDEHFNALGFLGFKSWKDRFFKVLARYEGVA